MTTDRPLRVALCSGIFVHYDAISNSIEHKLRILSELRGAGWPIEATVLVHTSDRTDPRVRVVDSVRGAIRLPEFRRADLHIFEFGISYPLFNAVFLVDRPLVGVYHNVTPPDLVLDPEAREAVELALVQKHNLARFDRISCVSEMSCRDLVEFGIPVDRLSVLPLPATVELEGVQPAPEEARRAGPVELLYVGRFVPAKGVLDLLDAVRRLGASGVQGFRVTLAGNVEYSSPAVVAQVLDAERSAWPRTSVRVVATPSNRRLAELYARADAVVLPSYHEGFCVPVVEALTMGCQVIAAGAGNIPNVLAGLGRIVQPGDVDGLTGAIADWIERVRAHRAWGRELMHPTVAGDVPDDAWRHRVRRQAERYSFVAYRRGFLRLLQSAAELRPEGSPPWLAEAIGAADLINPASAEPAVEARR